MTRLPATRGQEPDQLCQALLQAVLDYLSRYRPWTPGRVSLAEDGRTPADARNLPCYLSTRALLRNHAAHLATEELPAAALLNLAYQTLGPDPQTARARLDHAVDRQTLQQLLKDTLQRRRQWRLDPYAACEEAAEADHSP